VICGAEGWDEIEDFGEAKQDFLRSYGDFEAGIPDMTSENLAGIRHIAMNYLKSETSFKAGIKRKQKKAAMSESYLATILAA
jgi:hypothetical protein